MMLVEHCAIIACMDEAGTEIRDGAILVDGGVIRWLGGPGDRPPLTIPAGAERIDGKDLIAIPGLVNTHHHLYQVLTRLHAQEQGLFGWLTELYPIWSGLDSAWVRAAATIGLCELVLSGCTTTTDHHYVFPRGRERLIEAEITAAEQIGIRFHPCRGSMDLGTSSGGLPPDSVVEDMDTILADTEATIARFNDPEPGAMVRIAVGPCSPFSASDPLMRESAALARRLGVRLHTHIAETRDEEEFCRQRFDRRPIALLEDQGFLGPDVWLAHGVHLNADDIATLARTKTSVAWCPTSNARLGSGIAPVPELRTAGVMVGLAVDGSASNDSSNLLAEARQGFLMTRAQSGPTAMTARQVLGIATRGGAGCLGRDDIGSLEVGKRADIALYPVADLSPHDVDDQLAGLVFFQPRPVKHLFVEGKPVVRDGRIVTLEAVQA